MHGQELWVAVFTCWIPIRKGSKVYGDDGRLEQMVFGRPGGRRIRVNVMPRDVEVANAWAWANNENEVTESDWGQEYDSDFDEEGFGEEVPQGEDYTSEEGDGFEDWSDEGMEDAEEGGLGFHY